MGGRHAVGRPLPAQTHPQLFDRGLLAAPARSTNVRTGTAQHLLSMADAPEHWDGSAGFVPADQVLRGKPGHLNA